MLKPKSQCDSIQSFEKTLRIRKLLKEREKFQRAAISHHVRKE
jgi:hypothetical protein